MSTHGDAIPHPKNVEEKQMENLQIREKVRNQQLMESGATEDETYKKLIRSF
jgi:hypothetical protein